MKREFNDWIVVVYFGRSAPLIERFKDETKARSCYADYLLKYPMRNVELIVPKG